MALRRRENARCPKTCLRAKDQLVGGGGGQEIRRGSVRPTPRRGRRKPSGRRRQKGCGRTAALFPQERETRLQLAQTRDRHLTLIHDVNWAGAEFNMAGPCPATAALCPLATGK